MSLHVESSPAFRAPRAARLTGRLSAAGAVPARLLLRPPALLHLGAKEVAPDPSTGVAPTADREGARGRDRAAVSLTLDDWRRGDFDLLALDDVVFRVLQRHRRCELHFQAARIGPGMQRRAIGQVAIRYQRFTRTGNEISAQPDFVRLLAAHARMHDLSKPLVAADYDHALDTWAWVLRLQPTASLALQLAALFHDVERLLSEPDERIEQYAENYATFKAAHAAAGADMVREVLRELGLGERVAARTRDLVAWHELGAFRDAEAVVLTDADALSFFSLNASGFLRYYGRGHTARKVAYTMARLSPYARRQLSRIKVAREVRSLMHGLS